jgi:hypothetical protein
MPSKKERKHVGQKPLPGLNEFDEQPQDDRPKGMPTLDLIKTECARLGLLDSDAEYMFDRWLSNGYTSGRGRKVRDYKATIRVWYADKFFPSQKRKRVTRIEHVIQPPLERPAPPPVWTPPTLEEVIAYAKTIQPATVRAMPTFAANRAKKLGTWCHNRWVGNKWHWYGQRIDSTPQWQALMVEMSEEFDRLNR